MPSALRDASINLIALWAYPSGGDKAQLEIIVSATPDS